MSVTIQEVGRLSNGTRLTNEKDSNSILLPFSVLWDQARSGIIKLVHFSFDNVHEILGAADIKVSAPQQPLRLNSKLVSASFGRTGRIQFPNTVEVTLAHLTSMESGSAVCVSWSMEMSAWTDSGCSLVETSATETKCACDHMSVYGLAARLGETVPRPGFSIMTLQIVTYIVAGISVLCVVLILVKVGVGENKEKNIKKSLKVLGGGGGGLYCNTIIKVGGLAPSNNKVNFKLYASLVPNNHRVPIILGLSKIS